ncbi:MAG: hypothetical protein SA378_08350 [Sedimentibacter sp.]|uniref:hypothetical protein n=1 Tax=Sedimentibacter sp. TaxID=1960295 RepID=UPI002981AF52|nr:hypothetical protein [Sedimentibacter sp.]MDW5300132.1 hypothetical protein [Sedimentibacter sp.]
MKKTTMILLMILATAFIAFGCTKLPASQETGVGPAEYEGIINSDEIKKENENLKKELESTKTELEKMEKDYLNLAKNNELVISKLQEAETKLDIVESVDIPKFNSEKTDKNSILAYLNESKNVLDDSYREIEIIQSMESCILFCTVGYGDNFNQIFMWEVGQNEPVLIDGASFDKNGSWKWLLENKYIIIENGENKSEKKVFDVENKNIAGTFESNEDIYLLPETTTVLIQKPSSNNFVLYNFIISSEKELNLDNKNKYSNFVVDEEKNEITFKGTYTNDNGTEYFVQATMNIEKMKEIYEIKNSDEIEETEDIEETDEIKIEENVEPEGKNI